MDTEFGLRMCVTNNLILARSHASGRSGKWRLLDIMTRPASDFAAVIRLISRTLFVAA
jgi:hypothetical protein